MEKHISERGGEAVRPQARVAHLVIRELPDEDLIYDLKTHKAYCLNPIAAAVWKQCDGQQTIREMVKHLQPHYGQAINDEVVWAALQALSQANLLEAPLQVEPERAFRQRREALRRIGRLTAPFVISVIAPLAIQAQTCRDRNNNENENAIGCPCQSNNDCNNNCCGFGNICADLGLLPESSPCRVNCECDVGLSCKGSPQRCLP